MKKLLVCLIVMLCLLTFASAEEWVWNQLEDGTAEIVEYLGNADEVTVPAELDGCRVTAIGPYAFMKHSAVKGIVLPDGVSVIGDYAFANCIWLESIHLPEGLESIGSYAFTGCDALTSITLPANTVIEGANPFADCDLLTDIRVSPDASSLEVIGGVLFSKADKRLICYPYAFKNDSYAVPDGVLIIGEAAFSSSSLSSVALPDGLLTIKGDAFNNCNELTGIAIPDSVMSWGGANPFASCDKLASIQVSPEHPSLETKDGALFDKMNKRLICYPAGLTGESYAIPDGVQRIGTAAFQECNSLRRIAIPASVTDIEEYAFYACDALESIVIPDSVTAVNMFSFFKCSALTSVTVPASVTYIDEWAFILCNNLTLTVPRGSYAATWAEKYHTPYTYSQTK